MINVKDIVEVLAHYDYKRTEFPHNALHDAGFVEVPLILGISDDFAKRIVVDKNQPYESLRETIIHELHHCHHYIKGDLSGKRFSGVEKVVTDEAKKQFLQLYKK